MSKVYVIMIVLEVEDKMVFVMFNCIYILCKLLKDE